jgi:hypothetical protein
VADVKDVKTPLKLAAAKIKTAADDELASSTNSGPVCSSSTDAAADKQPAVSPAAARCAAVARSLSHHEEDDDVRVRKVVKPRRKRTLSGSMSAVGYSSPSPAPKATIRRSGSPMSTSEALLAQRAKKRLLMSRMFPQSIDVIDREGLNEDIEIDNAEEDGVSGTAGGRRNIARSSVAELVETQHFFR